MLDEAEGGLLAESVDLAYEACKAGSDLDMALGYHAELQAEAERRITILGLLGEMQAAQEAVVKAEDIDAEEFARRAQRESKVGCYVEAPWRTGPREEAEVRSDTEPPSEDGVPPGRGDTEPPSEDGVPWGEPDETRWARELKIPWQFRGPPPPDMGGPEYWRGSPFRKNSGKLMRRGGWREKLKQQKLKATGKDFKTKSKAACPRHFPWEEMYSYRSGWIEGTEQGKGNGKGLLGKRKGKE